MTKKADRMRSKRESAKALGICTRCLAAEAMPGQTKCGACSEWQAIYKESKRLVSVAALRKDVLKLQTELDNLRRKFGAA